MNNLNAYLESLVAKYQNETEGAPATYIPELAKANPDDFGIVVTLVDGTIFKAGVTQKQFSLQSASKPFVYGMALEEFGRDYIRTKVGVEPSGEAFNSIVELEKNTHRPYNPMINSGAIAISDMIVDKDGVSRRDRIIELFSTYMNKTTRIDQDVFLSEKKTAHRNRSIAHLLKHFAIVSDDIEGSLDLYFQQCSILANTEDLSMMAATLANGGIQPISKKVALQNEYVPDVLSLMFTCGMYDTSGEWAYTVGLPAKSGVSGGLLVVVPGKMGIASYSPLIDKQGHSIRGIKAIKEFVSHFNLNIFARD